MPARWAGQGCTTAVTVRASAWITSLTGPGWQGSTATTARQVERSSSQYAATTPM